jgi:hypothetical protein
MPAVCPVAAPEPTSAALQHELALELALRSRAAGALIVLADPLGGGEIGRCVVGPCLPAVDGNALLDLVLPSEATVCDVGRIHEPSLRRLARHWNADRLLVAPCSFGTTLVALAIVPLGPGLSARRIERDARGVCERFAAAVIGTRLLAHAATVPARATWSR